jgi:hypothetical protein
MREHDGIRHCKCKFRNAVSFKGRIPITLNPYIAFTLVAAFPTADFPTLYPNYSRVILRTLLATKQELHSLLYYPLKGFRIFYQLVVCIWYHGKISIKARHCFIKKVSISNSLHGMRVFLSSRLICQKFS